MEFCLVIAVFHIVANQRCEFFGQIVTRLRIICVGGKVDVVLVVVEMIDRRFGIIGEFFQQGVNTINRLMLPGRGSLSRASLSLARSWPAWLTWSFISLSCSA